MKDPVLHNEVHVIWRGMASNVVTNDEGTSFDLLVGYETRKVLEGIVPVIFQYAVSLNPEQPVEVLGRIIPGPDDRIHLEGIALHQSGNL
jgi:hypothetical protein